MESDRLRNFVFTINNPTYEDHIRLMEFINQCDYLIYALETGESGTDHFQGYAELKNQTRFSTIKKLWNGIHIEKRKGTAIEASNYCKKDGFYSEHGEISNPGARNDLIKLRDEIMNGKTVDEIAIEKPIYYHQYGRTMHKLEDLRMRKVVREKKMPDCKWFYGPTGTGKSYEAFKDFDPNTCYNFPYDTSNNWCDDYTQQKKFIINDFRGEISYNKLLQLTDMYPCTLNRRGRAPIPFTSSEIIITSSLHPEKVYKNRATEDKIEQLLRRFKIIKFPVSEVVNKTPGGGGNTNPPFKK